ncbi:glutamate-5-semialdehyde dehydrogenase [Litchfieldia salsa]|uniref:Gamma-glutamyl phosphate reductase n=1 Tax=Litchfieldia salsa TaxID=930152 RepID=A0A1H0TBW1_9BACI|nr:glutamate-5-semialdehyde dehydrogenase [Litchfieldia salsa]SDP51553.1 glutamate-5-semialdehyde dehydrogenase [Litchfieldia salsa]
MSEVRIKGLKAKTASYSLVNVTTDEKNKALKKISEQLLIDKERIIIQNQKDLEEGRKKGISESILDRIMLNEKRIEDMSNAIIQLIKLKDPIGETLEVINKENGLNIYKNRVPIGVIGMIYEARPNVTVDAATLSLKTGNSVILRGSSSAIHSNKILVATMHKALEQTNIPQDAILLIEDTSRETAKDFFHLNEFLDVLIPRGGKNLIETVIKEATVPVIETGAGNCHIYIDDNANVDMATNVVLNAKTQRPSVCNAVETLLIHERWFENNGKQILQQLDEHGVEIIGDEHVVKLHPNAKIATEDDLYMEYLDLTICIKIVKSLSEAITHINKFGTRHSEAIITENKDHANSFLTNIDAAAVYHNASTRFTDGFEFGYGAEIGISTQKLHARGPMGLNALTSTKFFIYGTGQIRE